MAALGAGGSSLGGGQARSLLPGSLRQWCVLNMSDPQSSRVALAISCATIWRCAESKRVSYVRRASVTIPGNKGGAFVHNLVPHCHYLEPDITTKQRKSKLPEPKARLVTRLMPKPAFLLLLKRSTSE